MSGVLNLLLAGAASAIKDAYFNLTTLLLNTSSTNGAQNNTFLDSSTNNFTITRNGNTTQGTFTPFSQTGWSNYFNGDVNCDLQTPSNAAFGYGTGDFCLEAYVYQQTDANARIIDHTAGAFNFGLLSTGIVTLFDGSTTHNTPSSSVSLNTWTHICATRQGSTLRLFVNGVLKYNTTFTVSKADSAVNIGSNPGGGGETLNGYISNLRIVKGGVPSAYSTSSTTNGTTVFTPSTTPLSASASLTAGSLSLLTCQSNRFVDNSANAFAISVTAGTPSVQAFSPFLPTAAYDAAVVGGSGYFDGSGDYLITDASSNLTPGSGDFTAECWCYAGAVVNDDCILDITNNTSVGLMLFQRSNNALGVYNRQSSTVIITTANNTLIPNQWQHLVVQRSGSTVTVYIDGVSKGTATDSTNFTGNKIAVASYSEGGGYYTGYVSGVRFLKGTALYSSTFTPPTAPPTAITNTALLLNFTNAGIYDSAAKNVLETVGNAQVSTTQSKWGTTSMYFDGSGDAVKAIYNPSIDFGTGDFTIECWVYITNISPGYSQTVLGRWGASGGTIWIMQIQSGGTFRIVVAPSNVWTGGSVSANTWTHLAITRSGSSLRVFTNGTLSSTNTDTTSLSGSQVLSVGGQYDGTDAVIGYMDDVRITKGYARYTATFTPPTAPFPVQ